MLSDALITLLYEKGASLAGFADLGSLADPEMPVGISVAIALPARVVRSIHDGPTLDYDDQYHALNRQLNDIVTTAAEFLKGRGYRAFAQTTDAVREFGIYRTALPHKTVATRAGIGWVGKSALLVTEAFGSAVRLSSLTTNAPLPCAVPITVSNCGNCTRCGDACPAQALKGLAWTPQVDRDELVDPIACRQKARALTKLRTGQEASLCGKCMEVCPYTQKYLASIQA
jgi:epoxyqueuosine reductase QueG